MERRNAMEYAVIHRRYKQVEEFLLSGISSGEYPIGGRLPSVIQMAERFGYAAKTVHKAYKALMEQGVIESVPRKGYYVISTHATRRYNIFLLLDNYSSYKQSLFQTIKRDFGRESELTVFFHFYDPELLRRYIRENRGKYTTYIVSPFYMEDLEEHLSMLPPERLYLLGRHPKTLVREYHGVFQNFRQDIIKGLTATGDRMWHYNRLVLCFRDSVTTPPLELLRGFVEYCKDRKMEYRVLHHLDSLKIYKGEAYIVIDDQDLIALVRLVREKGYRLGEDVGIISYNDTPMKEIVGEGGVSVISTDFVAMGHAIVRMVQEHRYDHLLNPCYFINRGSF